MNAVSMIGMLVAGWIMGSGSTMALFRVADRYANKDWDHALRMGSDDPAKTGLALDRLQTQVEWIRDTRPNDNAPVHVRAGDMALWYYLIIYLRMRVKDRVAKEAMSDILSGEDLETSHV